jgi:hypothetical protein
MEPGGKKSILLGDLHLEWTYPSISRQICAMGQTDRPTCPQCGTKLTMALAPDGKGQRKPQCLDCDGPDPLKTTKVTGWLKSDLQPPR